MPKKNLRSMVSDENQSLGQPIVLRGSNLDQFASTQQLGLIERSTAFGVNTAAMYGVKNGDAPLKAPLAILLRLYAAFPDKLPRTWTPTFTEFWLQIKKVDPEFKEYQVGPLLGMDKNSIYRIRKDGFESSKESTKILVLLIYRLLIEDPESWHVIKDAVETEAVSRDLVPDEIWKRGKWQKHETDSTSVTKKEPGRRKILKTAEDKPAGDGQVSKTVIWR